ncbi:MAG: glycosyltransferase involved in cell wall biosynthesis [Saprospiraceae bacterium]|jgi:glycosyltransferase involved in cell wall biosynthesis
MDPIKVLIITYYWPPCGGAGVQRWVKLTKYFKNQNIIPYVITVDENSASYMQIDNSLLNDVPDEVKVYKTKSFEPINYYAKIVGKDKVPTAGFSNVNNETIFQKVMNTIRSNFFIPDPRRGWNRFAYKKAVELIKKENIKVVLTTSPPHSSQLIGLRLQKNMNVKWIADLRDPWVDIYYYKLLRHSYFSNLLNEFYEKKVLLHADRVLTVSDELKKLFDKKTAQINSTKIRVLPNGYDNTDYDNMVKSKNSVFTITYTGTMSDEYDPGVFFSSMKELMAAFSSEQVKLKVIGSISDSIRKQILEAGIDFEFVPYVTHKEIIQHQVDADMLFLVIPNVKNAEGILTGKLFEYLATDNRIICIGPESGDAAKIITKCEAGKTFSRESKAEIVQFLKDQMNNFLNDTLPQGNQQEINMFSRKSQTKIVREALEGLV